MFLDILFKRVLLFLGKKIFMVLNRIIYMEIAGGLEVCIIVEL